MPDYTNNFDSKWKDQSNPCKYDVSDPAFCSPLSVLSGLVSGFCERMAVAKIVSSGGTVESGTVTNLKNNVTWKMQDDTSGNSAVVSRLTSNLALHAGEPGEVDPLFDAPVEDPVFHMPDMDVDSQTYMTKMDDVLTAVIDMNVYKTDITGTTAYTSFEQLAASAVSAANANNSALAATPVKGGTNYSQEFMPVYPVEWAKERKWMMDQLRFTGGGSSTLISFHTAPYDVLGSAREYSVGYNVLSGSAFALYNDILDNGTADGDMGLSTSNYASAIQNTNSYGFGELTQSVTSFGNIYDPFHGDLAEVYMRGHCAHFNVSAVSVDGGTVSQDGWELNNSELAGFYLCENLSLLRTVVGAEVTLPVSISFAQGSPREQYYEMYGSFTVVSSDMAVVAEDHMGYEIKSGGVCTISSGTFADACVVSSGGLLHMENGAKAASVSVLTGGTFTGYINSYEFNTSGFYMFGAHGFSGADYTSIALKTLPLVEGGSTEYTVVAGNSTVSTTASYQAYYVVSGGTLTLNAYMNNSLVIVDAGGNLVINSDGGVEHLYILPGGSCSVYSDGISYYVLGNLVVYPTGHFEMHRTKHQDHYPTTGIYSQVVIAPGCEFILDEPEILAATEKTLTARCMLYLDASAISGNTVGTAIAEITDGTNALTYPFFETSYVHIFAPLQLCSSGTDQFIHQGWNVFNNVTFSDDSRLASVVIKGGTAALPELPLSGICIGMSGANVSYRCAIEAVEIPVSSGSTPSQATDQYQKFKLRQNQT